MPRTVKCGLIQATNAAPTDAPIEEIKRLNIEKHLKLIEQAAPQGVQILCMQEVFTTPYFCAEQQTRWYEAVERIPDGPTVKLMQEVAKKHGMVIVVPIYEEEIAGIYYNTAAVIDADGKYLGKYRKNHIPHVNPGFWEKFYFRPATSATRASTRPTRSVGVYICYDRHFPEGARALGPERRGDRLQPVGHRRRARPSTSGSWSSPRTPSPTATSSAPSTASATKQPWDIGEFYGQSYFCDPRGQIIAEAPRDKDALVVADLDLDMIREVRNTWQFFRDRRPDTYQSLVAD